MSTVRRRTVIMISGRGSNMARLIDVAAEPDFPAEIVGVISDHPEAPGLVYAAGRKIPARSIARGDFASKAEHEKAISDELSALGTELVCLAGYMRLLSTSFVEQWTGRMINIHPSLLPGFPGLDTHRRALEAGLRIHGCTVHFVTPAVDSGPIIAQAAVPVLLDDDEPKLAARVLKAEHELYPMALRLVAEGKARMEGARTAFSGLRQGGKDASARLFAPAPWDDHVDLEALARFTP